MFYAVQAVTCPQNTHHFCLIYNRELVLPVDLKYRLNSVDLYEPLDQDIFETVLSTANAMRDRIHEAAGRNIKKVQTKQKQNFDRRHLSSSTINVGNKVLLKDNRRNDKKGGKKKCNVKKSK